MKKLGETERACCVLHIEAGSAAAAHTLGGGLFLLGKRARKQIDKNRYIKMCYVVERGGES